MKSIVVMTGILEPKDNLPVIECKSPGIKKPSEGHQKAFKLGITAGLNKDYVIDFGSRIIACE